MNLHHGCHGFLPTVASRRRWLQTASTGFGALALSALAPGWQAAAAAAPAMHHPPRAKRVVFLFMAGGVSQVDTFDPKPKLQALDGKPAQGGRKYLGSPWKFAQYGEAGLPVSELFPHTAQHVDKLAIVRSMKAEFPLHARGCLFLHTGRNVPGSPSLGSWINYGLGSENENLPGYVVLQDGNVPAGGMENFSSAYLPANYQASLLAAAGEPIRNLTSTRGGQPSRTAMLAALAVQDRAFAAVARDDAVDSAIRNYEIAAGMQTAMPLALELKDESAAVRKLYGLDSSNDSTRIYGEQCLRARRLLEAGVRFVEISMFGLNTGGWDQHGNLRKQHAANALTTDQPIAGLLQDLAARGMLDDTLVLCAGEMGRTVDTGNGDGRDHLVTGFTVWLAGGGIRGGCLHGATDELGETAVENVCTMHDLHATILHLLGLDHTRLTFRFGGRDHRLTDVHGQVVRPILA